MNVDSRIAQLRQEVRRASACLDDARCIVADLVDSGLTLDGLDAQDFQIIRGFTNQALMKVRGCNAALARLEDRAKRQAKYGGVSA